MMAQISKGVLNDGEWRLMWRRFVETFGRTKNTSSLHLLFKGLLTPTEQVVLAKRIVAGFLLLSDWKAYEVAATLKLSISSVYKYQNFLEHDKDYRGLLTDLLTKKIPREEFEVKIEGRSPLIKLLENIFDGYTHRSKLIYGE